MERMCLIALLILGCTLYVESAHLITCSRVFRTGTTEKLSVSLYDVDTPWNITAQLNIKRGKKLVAIASKFFSGNSPGELELKIPQDFHFNKGFGNALLTVQGYATGAVAQGGLAETDFNETQPITIEREAIALFIQTDKPIYKPGQTIRMRVIGTEPDLKPLTGKIKRVTIANPTGVRMMQWNNLEFNNGIASLELPLSSQPVLGKWKVEAKVQGKKIVQVVEVAKYVLPKFEVIIRPPPFVAIDSKEVTATICARYTYGQQVSGKLKVTVSLQRQWWWYYNKRNNVKIQIEKEIKGCTDITLSNKELGLKGYKYTYYGTSLQFDAIVTEKATGVSRNATTTKTPVVPYRVKMNFHPGTSKHFKPGLPFHGQLRVNSPDGTPLSGESVTISASTEKGKMFSKKYKVTNGIVNFVIQDVKPGTQYLSINARHGAGEIFGKSFSISDWHSTAGIYCTPWYSASWSFLGLRRLQTPLRVGSKARINFQYTLQKPEHTGNFNFFVMCGGKLVHSGKKTITFKIDPSVVKPVTTPRPEATTTDKPTTTTDQPTTTSTDNPTTSTDIPTSTDPITTSTRKPKGETSTTPRTPDTTEPPIVAVGVGKGERRRRPPITVSPEKGSKVKPPSGRIFAADGFIKFKVTQAMVPSCRLLVFYVRKDLETVADSMEVDVEDKLENQVSVRFGDHVRKPGQPVTITLSGAPGSRVAVSAVDKSVHLLRAANELTEEKIMKVLSSRDVGSSGQYGRKKKCKWTPWWGGRPVPFGAVERKKRSSPIYYRRTNYVDASKAFYDTGLIYFSSLGVETRPCPPSYPYHITRMGPMESGGGGGMEERGPVAVPIMLARPDSGSRRRNKVIKKKIPKVKQAAADPVRKNFPETWLWTEETVSDETGKKVITAQVPDTITSWYASAFAMSGTHGIGVSPPASLTVFKPFFVSFTLPYSVIRGEQVSIITTVFNYMSRCMTIRVQLTKTKDFELQSADNKSICVCANEAKSVQFTITPRKLGRIPLTLRASDALPSVCEEPGEEARVGVMDTVIRKLLVEPEGVRREYTYSSFVCPRDTEGIFTDRMDISLPAKIIDGSVRATVSAIGDLMGPSLSGLDGLLRLPTGCGEQNMVNFAPNIYIMQYLNSTRQMTKDVETKAVGFLRTGYQREQTYKRKDGSYSAFGNRDKEGSLWLTAFVLRSFAQARPFIFIDEKETNSTAKWIVKKQLETGCFKPHGKLFHKALKGGVSSPVTLTAFIAISLLESGVSPSSKVITKAFNCIASQKNTVTDSYGNAILAYAYTLARHADRDEFLKRLKAKVIFKDGMMHWEMKEPSRPKPGARIWSPPYYRARGINIEMTSYALMALIGDGSDTNALAGVLPVVRWLTQQRNGLGGFSSTQDTCVALQALSRYAGHVFGDSTRMRIDVGFSGGQFSHQFRITESNRLVLQRVPIPAEILPTTIPIDAFGEGCALVQADVSYNIPEVEEEPAFQLKVKVSRRSSKAISTELTETGEELCQPLEMNICAKWLKEGASNMAVIETKLVSGFSADEESLERLTNRHDLGLMRYEIDGNKVVLYFDEIKHVCVTFGIHQTTVVKKTKPASVTVYDYYDTDLSATISYNISEKLCYPTQEPPTPSVPPKQPSCPVCPDKVDVSLIMPRLCKSKTVIGVRKMKDGSVRMLEYYNDVTLVKGGKKSDKKYTPIDLVLPQHCACVTLDARSKAFIFLQDKKSKKKLRKLALDDKAVVLSKKIISSKTLPLHSCLG